MPRFTWFPRALILPHAAPIAVQEGGYSSVFKDNESLDGNSNPELPNNFLQCQKNNNRTPEEVKGTELQPDQVIVRREYIIAYTWPLKLEKCGFFSDFNSATRAWSYAAHWHTYSTGSSVQRRLAQADRKLPLSERFAHG